MTGLRIWFDGRSLREKRLLLVMAALAALTLVWAGIILPVGDGLASARSRHADAVLRLGETEARVDALRDVQKLRPPPLTGALVDVVRGYAADAGFALASVDPDGADRVRVGIASARPGALVPWLARLERAGILVDAAAMTNNGDRTVGATLTLRARAS